MIDGLLIGALILVLIFCIWLFARHLYEKWLRKKRPIDKNHAVTFTLESGGSVAVDHNSSAYFEEGDLVRYHDCNGNIVKDRIVKKEIK